MTNESPICVNSSVDFVRTTCSLCFNSCGLIASRENNEINLLEIRSILSHTDSLV